VGPDQFKGLLVLDRWQVAPSLTDLVSDIGPDLGMPKRASHRTLEGDHGRDRGSGFR